MKPHSPGVFRLWQLARIGAADLTAMDAIDGADDGQLVLDLDGPIGPLAIRFPADPGTFSVLMPVNLR